jgi:hypothetical protein
LLIICTISVAGGSLFLKESYVTILLAQPQKEKEKENGEGGKHYLKEENYQLLTDKLVWSIQRPLRILFTQHRALIFTTKYSLYTQFI